MNFRKFLIAAAAALSLVELIPSEAFAFSQVLCSQTSTARRVTNTSSTASPQPSYQLNARGCAPIAQADVGYFLTQGFTPGPPFSTILAVTGVITGTTAVQIATLPPNAYIREIIVNNSTANAVTGGIDIGTTSGAADVVSALTCAANCLTFVADAALLKRVFSTTAQQALFALGHTAGNSANLNITIIYGYF